MTKLCSLALFWTTALLLSLSLGAAPLLAQVTFLDFSDPTGLTFNGSATTATNGNSQKVLRLTADGMAHVSGSTWFSSQQQSVSAGFTTVFQFQITHTGQSADGFAFVIQNSTGEGFGTAALGGSGGAIGYGVPDPGDTGVAIPDSLAVEFDTFQNSWDPNANHIAVQSCGTAPNSQDHTNPLCALGITSDLGGITLADGNVHTGIVDYDPGPDNTPGILRVFLDDSFVPKLVINNINLSSLLTLNAGSAWVGFTGAAGDLTENNDVLNWTFTPATTQTTITQDLMAGAPADTDYVFGSYDHDLSYSGAQSGDSVTVTAIPIDQKTFHDTRLMGTPFSNGNCVIYEGTGGLCVMFEVTCSQEVGSDCTDLNYDLSNSFNSGDSINGACVLKAPISTNNWSNIIESFTDTPAGDPASKSKSKGFSDFIVGQGCTSAPSININQPANGGFYSVGQSITVDFSCTPDPNAPNVTVTSCTGVLNGNPVTSGQSYTFGPMEQGTGTLVVSASDSVMNASSKTSTFTVGTAPAITSSNHTVFKVGMAGSFLVMTTGSPAPAITETGGLPSGVTLVDNHNGTATLGGVPAANTGGTYHILLKATNGIGSATQNFLLTVNQAPAITSTNHTTFPVGVESSFTVTTTGFPTPALSYTGNLPSGVTFADNEDGTGTLSGVPTTPGVFPITFRATSVAGQATQYFTLTVSGPSVQITPTNINFGNINRFQKVSKSITVKNTGTSDLHFGRIYLTLGPHTDRDDFNVVNFCDNVLHAGKTCTLLAIFYGDDIGQHSATINITDDASNSPQHVGLKGNVNGD